MFRAISTRQSFLTLEQEIDQWWQEHAIVQKALASGDPARSFVFFEGPPTANGAPGIHTLEPRVFKDVVIRYRRMRGHRIIGARAGWDTQGIPVELQVERELGFTSKHDIERYGIAEFNQACQDSVWRYVREFEDIARRIAHWLDLDDAYATCTNTYIESLWWILQTLWQKDLLFRDYKVSMHCPRCGTSLSDHEVAQGYRDNVEDPSVWLRFRHQSGVHPLDEYLANSALLVWTTTPWTLPANVALAVKPASTYVLVEYTVHTPDGTPERLLLAEALAAQVLGADTYTVLATFSGDELRDVQYQPLFQGVAGTGEAIDWQRMYRVIVDDFVSLEDGTGIVHIAPAYGDLEIGRTHTLPTLFSVDLDGKMLPDFASLGFGEVFFKQADPLIIDNLQQRGLLFRSERVRHGYPVCWRCDTPLLYYAKPSWYIRTTRYKDQLVANNELIQWMPEHIKHGRFGNWLEHNVDWALSRERYWGTPLPIWICDTCQQIEVIGSIAELSQHAGQDLHELDLHRPYVDQIHWPCRLCATGTYRRVPDVADAWFDSGSMPIAQWHYPFEHQEIFASAQQADFISEAIDQTRGWFYTLHALATLLFERPAYKNVICLGLIMDERGQKMSKSRHNMVDSRSMLDTYGADALRWFLYASAPPYNQRNFAPASVAQLQREFLLTLWNTAAFFVTYANVDGWQPPLDLTAALSGVTLQVIDRWVLARLNALVRAVTVMFESYDVYGPTRDLARFVEDLSNWYVRRNRRRFWKAEQDSDKRAAYLTLYTCLTTLTRLLAPFVPFISEALYRHLVAEPLAQHATIPESVHLAAWPQVDATASDEHLLQEMDLLLQVIRLGRAARQNAGLRVRQPLNELLVYVSADLHKFAHELREELNVHTVRFASITDTLVEYHFKPNLPLLGKKYGRLVPALRSALSALQGATARSTALALEAGETVALTINGQTVQLLPEEVLISLTSPQRYAVAAGDGILVALDTTLTPELVQEGLARDLVRLIQDARKTANFAITEHISVILQPHGPLDLTAILVAYAEYIRTETLADEIQLGTSEDGCTSVEVELAGEQLTIGVRRLHT